MIVLTASSERPVTVDMRPDPDYWMALGEFVEGFASTEISLFYFLTRTAHVSADVGRALFGASRAKDYVSHIRRIWKVEPPLVAHRVELDDVLGHFMAINETRNIIIHYPAVPYLIRELRTTSHGDGRSTDTGDSRIATSDPVRICSDFVRAIDPNYPTRERTVSPTIVRAMTADLLKISQHLISLMTFGTLSLQERGESFPAIPNAWQYTPEQ